MGSKRYSEEFKQETVRLYGSAGKSYKELGRDLA